MRTPCVRVCMVYVLLYVRACLCTDFPNLSGAGVRSVSNQSYV